MRTIGKASPAPTPVAMLDRLIFEDAPIGMALVCPRGRFLHANRAFCRFLGYSRQEVLQKTIRDITHPGDWPESTRLIRSLFRHGSAISRFEKRYLHKSGRVLWGAVSSRPVKDSRGRMRFTIAQIVDITDRKEIEAALREDEERYKIWLEAIPMLAWRCDPQGKCIDCNQRWLHYTGQTLAQVRGEGWMKAVHPKDRGRVLKKVRDDVTGGEFYECEYRLRRAADGAYRWHLARAYPLKDQDGRILMWLGAAPDIEDLKRLTENLQLSETRFRVALQGAPITAFSQDRNLVYTWAYNSAPGFRIEDVLGKKDRDLYPAADARHYARIKRTVLRTGASRRDEVVAHTKAGEMIFDMTTEPLRDVKGNIVGVMGAAVNITHQKRMEQQLRDSHEELERQVQDRTARLRILALELTQAEQKERRRIAHILHEDLQQHLVAMQYRIQELKERHPHNAVTSTAGWLLQEVRQIIRISRGLTSQLRPPILYEFGLHAALEWLAEDLRAQFKFKVSLKARRAFTLKSDELSIFAFEAVRELLMNCIKHAGVKTADVSIRRVRDHVIAIEVSDKGSGFDPAHTILNKFGLFSIRERAHALGGDLAIVSRPGRGTTVTLTLPLA